MFNHFFIMSLTKNNIEWRVKWSFISIIIFTLIFISQGSAHNVAGHDADFVSNNQGSAIFPFLYLGAKHMITGYDHLLYLAAILFFIHRFREILICVTLFSLGHSLTLIFGVLTHITLNGHIVDAIIGLSIVYKAYENLGGFRAGNIRSIPPHYAIFSFGMVHGLGLATKILELNPMKEGLFVNLLSFNIGVEIGQFLALTLLILLIYTWKKTNYFELCHLPINIFLMLSGFILTGYQLAFLF